MVLFFAIPPSSDVERGCIKACVRVCAAHPGYHSLPSSLFPYPGSVGGGTQCWTPRGLEGGRWQGSVLDSLGERTGSDVLSHPALHALS